MLTAIQPSPVDVLVARRELDLVKRRQELRRENLIYFYQPHEKQKVFHAAADFRFRYARTGNRFGKSEMGAAEDVAYALGFRPWLAEGDPMRTLGIPQHPTKGLIVTTDWDKSTEVFTCMEEGTNKGKLFKYIPKDCFLGFTRNHSGAIDMVRVRHVTGGVSVIHLDTVKSFKQNPLGQESSVWDWVHIDEPCPEAMWKAIVRGLTDRGGHAWFTCTPMTEPWIDVCFIPNLEDISKATVGVIESTDSRWMMTGEMDDNPHLTPEDIAMTMSWYTPEERETRRKGIPAAYSGIICKEFSWDVHVLHNVPTGWKSWDSPPEEYTLRLAIDYHPRKPHHVLFIATSPDGYQYVWAEIFLSCLMSELVAQVRLTLMLRDLTVPGLIDPLAKTPNQVTDITAMDEVMRLGLPVLPATKDPHNGVMKIRALLKARDRMGGAILRVNPACKRFLFEISRGWIWDKDTNKPKKENDDAMENFYRLCLQGLTYIEPPSVNDYVPIKPKTDFSDNIVDLSTYFEERSETSSLALSSRYRK